MKWSFGTFGEKAGREGGRPRRGEERMGGRRTDKACIVMRWTAGTIEEEKRKARRRNVLANSN